MGSESVEPRPNRIDPVLGALTSRRRRLVLAALTDESATISLAELTTRVAPVLHDVSTGDVGAEVRKRERTALVHRALPKLSEAGLVAWDRDGDAIAVTDHPALANPRLEPILDSPDDDWDDVLEALAHERRHVALSVLVDHGEAIGRRNLARRVVARERDVATAEVESGAVDEALATLHHVHLPKLHDANLLVEDDLATVRYADHPILDEESLAPSSPDALASRASVAP